MATSGLRRKASRAQFRIADVEHEAAAEDAHCGVEEGEHAALEALPALWQTRDEDEVYEDGH